MEMSSNLFGLENSKINITIFSDERKNLNNQWDYMCLLIIPTKKINNVYEEIMSLRKRHNYNHEIKFSKLNSTAKGDKLSISKDLINEILNDSDNRYYFKIFGIDKNTINKNRFGSNLSEHELYANIYNRFYRTNILQLKGYFKNQDIEIDNIFHDNEGNLEQHKYFNWHSIFKVEQDEKINCNTDKIQFINSNHNLEQTYNKESHIIQMVDILLGAVTQCIEYHNKKNKSQFELAKMVFPYVDRIINEKPNWNSEYHYFGRFDINFFPLILPEWYKQNNFKNSIYKKREIQISKIIQEKNRKDNGIDNLFK